MSITWYRLKSGPGQAAFNMALDEALLVHSPRLARPVLRFYSWLDPAATFGFFQKYAQIAQWTPLRPLIRRPTGGGLVPHQADWTYSLIFPPNDPWYSLPAVASYQQLHEWIQNAFAALGARTHLAPTPQGEAIGQCFVGASQFDLLWEGNKIAGAAQRRTRTGLLIQGSVQSPPPGIARADWERAMCAAVPVSSEITWFPLELEAELNELAIELARSKFSQPAYNQRR